jgi:hypothetical protein
VRAGTFNISVVLIINKCNNLKSLPVSSWTPTPTLPKS